MTGETHLIHDYLTGEATDDECRRLEAWMKQDADHVDRFVREAFLHRALHVVRGGIVPAAGAGSSDAAQARRLARRRGRGG